MSQNKTDKHPKWMIYAHQLLEILHQASKDGELDLNEVLNEDNVTDFIYALSMVMPAKFYGGITGDEVNYLEFNHITNHLCFQFMYPEIEDEKD